MSNIGWTFVVALSAGVVGGAVARSPFPATPAVAQQQSPAVREPAESVQAKRIEVVDNNGQVRIVLTTFPDGRPVLNFRDQEGKTRIVMDLMETNGAPVLGFADVQEKERLVLRLEETGGTPKILFHDESGKDIWQAP